MDYTTWLTALFTVADLWVLMTARSIHFGKSDSFGNKTRLGKWLKLCAWIMLRRVAG